MKKIRHRMNRALRVSNASTSHKEAQSGYSPCERPCIGVNERSDQMVN